MPIPVIKTIVAGSSALHCHRDVFVKMIKLPIRLEFVTSSSPQGGSCLYLNPKEILTFLFVNSRSLIKVYREQINHRKVFPSRIETEHMSKRFMFDLAQKRMTD